MSIKCGNCRESHETVQEVRACYGGQLEMNAAVAREEPGVTPNQLYFLNTLRAERGLELYPDGSKLGVPRVKMTLRAASKEIDNLIHNVPKLEVSQGRQAASGKVSDSTRTKVAANNREHLRRNAPHLAEWDLPTGTHRYAIDGDDGRQTDFYKIDRPTEGRWAGRTFVKMVVGGKPSFPVKGARASRVLMEIEKDWDRAGVRYGAELGHCRHCGIHLTDETSRTLGAGPDCRAKHGVPA
jgi:Family of unknown function (DUF6011)